MIDAAKDNPEEDATGVKVDDDDDAEENGEIDADDLVAAFGGGQQQKGAAAQAESWAWDRDLAEVSTRSS